MATLEELFAGRNLTAMVQGIKPELPLVVPPSFLSPTDRVPGDTAEWYEVDGNREMALVVSQDSPARRVGHPGATVRSAKMFRTFESQAFAANRLRNLMAPDGSNVRDDMGRQFIRQSSEWFARRLINLKQTAVQRMLLQFSLHFNEAGAMLTSSSGATVSISPAIAAGQTGQLDILGGGAIISASWATASTNIPVQLATIRQQMLKLGGWQVTEAYYGKNIAGYIAANDYSKTLIQNTPALATQVFNSAVMVPSGFAGFNWHYAGDAFYVDAAGSIQHLLGDDEIVFTPSPADTSWWGLFYGSEMVPVGNAIGADASGALANLREVNGEFSYATVTTNPPGIEQFAGLNFLPVIKGLKAVCRCDVTP
jgi:hypothetical protein